MQVSAFCEIQMINGLPLSIIDCIDKTVIITKMIK